jgi:hypothetical protein
VTEIKAAFIEMNTWRRTQRESSFDYSEDISAVQMQNLAIKLHE